MNRCYGQNLPFMDTDTTLDSATPNSPFNYTGSKHKLLPQLFPLFDLTKPNFLDLFAGGGSVYTAALPLYEKVWANDRIAELVGVHQGLIERGDAFIAEVKALCVAKTDQAGYVALRDAFNRERQPAQLYALMLCCTNNMIRFNQSLGFNQTFGKRTFNASTQKKLDEWLAFVRPFKDKLRFTALSFEEARPVNPSAVMIYADPPYGAGTSVCEGGYNAFWSQRHEDMLYDYLKDVDAAGGSFALSGMRGTHKGGAEASIITRLTADGYEVIDINHDYAKVARDKAGTRGQEVLIRNYRT